MYIRPSALPRDPQHVRDVIRDHMFAVMISNTTDGLFATHLPFLHDADRGEHGTLVAHLAKANAHARHLADGTEVMVIFSGEHGYISPSWYPRRDAAPTWNYVAIHCYGVPVITPPEETLHAIARLVERMEASRSNRWTLGELSEDETARLLRHVVAFEIPLSRIDAKFKLSQAELPENRAATIDQLERDGEYELARWMRATERPGP
ncbi:MAG TPA: FMN-binding negative transcriptional regulator [Thermoanaerobaculia bacterium]|nr:FMN-binding negative transcriptional regulator [Thermoanaerobaculia bacterium]